MSTLGVKKHVKYGVYNMYQKSVCTFSVLRMRYSYVVKCTFKSYTLYKARFLCDYSADYNWNTHCVYIFMCSY